MTIKSLVLKYYNDEFTWATVIIFLISIIILNIWISIWLSICTNNSLANINTSLETISKELEINLK